jgi:hypothetical protein
MYGAALPHPGVGIEHVVIRSPSAVIGSAAAQIEYAESTIRK